VALANSAAAVLDLYHAAVAHRESEKRRRLLAHRDFEDRLLALCTPFLADSLAVHAKLCRRIAKHPAELFFFVVDPRVPATNNGAERSLRHLVTSRKTSGGTHSTDRTEAKMTLASLFATWRLQSTNPFTAFYALLQSPNQ
jgi:hypothetical protein